ncbi:MAG: SF1B family DNA helicase RecD2 [Armatimonadota bacterium]
MTSMPTITKTGTVQWLYCSSPSFSAGLLVTDAGEQVRFRGRFFIQAGECVALTGTLTTHPTYGEQLHATQLTYDLALEPAGLAHYLATHPAFHGIGPAKAERIATAFGATFDQVIRDTPEQVRAVAHLSAEDCATLQREWLARSEINALASWLSAFGLTHHQLTKIVDRYGASAKSLLTADPYLLCREVDGFGFTRTDAVAQKLGTPKDHPGRIAAAVKDVIGQQADAGHCWMVDTDVLRETERLLALDTLDGRQQIHAGITALCQTGDIIQEEGHLGSPHLYVFEQALRQMLLLATALSAPKLTSNRLDTLMEDYAGGLTFTQRKAVRLALTSRLSVIAGAAGSGKSFSIAVIQTLCEALGRRVALAAPTGKAAKRLEEVCGGRAHTLHRLLGYDGQTWTHDATCPLDIDVLIVDEASMIDVELAWRVLCAVDFARTQVLFVGDPHQLPPVGPGHWLRDLLARADVPTIILDQVVRQAGTLNENATAILKGKLAATAPGTAGVLRPWYVIDDLSEADALVAALLTLVEDKLPALGFDPVRDVQILTPFQKGPLGARRLNAEIQRIIQRQRYGRELPPVTESARLTLYPGDKVMQTRNNYQLDVMNGSMGTLVTTSVIPTEAGTQRVLLVEFDGRTVDIPVGSDAANELTLAYVATVHKCQGSEFPCVVAVLHRMHTIMLHRHLLYTAVTRARQTAILLGDHNGMQRALRTTTADDRRTWLSVWDAPACSPSRKEPARA